MNIVSRRIVIRAVEPSDAAELSRIANSAELMSTFDTAGFPSPCSEELAGRWVVDSAKKHDEDHMVAALKADGKIRALLSVVGRDARNRSGRVCFLCDCRAEKDAAEAMGALLEHLIDRMNFHRVSARVPREDARAVRMHERVGFVTEGVMRQDHFHGGSWRDSAWMSVLEGERRRGRR